ncbi:fumarylacetoacetate hydrolase family protein [Paenibacillus sp. LHD-117]|uniref:fumarylacetoacetate hydrolase family protein n=1 Tax=Paenibacillus sp. LHD-117 TaxID=3071412 RepID=UPI0027E10371|nr:fumarylacetoacetate hydrolase family protein [Paenibacillus sp. LHD-117]MDQ6419708.1 fumarylacetoacetate hydrolase family protein [Paenibacillus sp. LHD-117]
MKLLTFATEEGLRLGVKTESGVVEIPAEDGWPRTMESLIAGGDKVIKQVKEHLRSAIESGNLLQEEDLTFGPCVPNPGKIICVGLNYREHAAESNMSIPEFPVLFNKFNNSISAHGQTIPLPPSVKEGDYEVELVIVIGQTASKVSRDEALEHVFGYCIANDLSSRDLQFRTNQWMLGKSLDHFCPIGPYLVTAEEVGDPNRLEIGCRLNGEIRQQSNTSDMIFYCDELVSYISEYITLNPGDIILTGTPQGVIFGYPPEKRIWLKDGDEIVVEISKLGSLKNRIRG